MLLRNGKCYISEVEAWWNTLKNTKIGAEVALVETAVVMGWMSKATLRSAKIALYTAHRVAKKVLNKPMPPPPRCVLINNMAEICDDDDDDDDTSEDENIPCYSCGADKDTPCNEMTCSFRIANREANFHKKLDEITMD